MSSFRSKSALQLNILNLANFNQVSKISFWTFTLPCVLHPKDAAALWRCLCRDLVRAVGFRGVRVFELHPSGHGLHVHVLACGTYSIHRIMRVASRNGWGRIDVRLVRCYDRSRLSSYLSKYLAKQVQYWRGSRISGIRWWSCFGDLRDSIRVSDVTVDSPFARIYKRIPDFIVQSFYRISDVSSKAFRFAKLSFVRLLYCGNSVILRDPFCSDVFREECLC